MTKQELDTLGYTYTNLTSGYVGLNYDTLIGAGEEFDGWEVDFDQAMQRSRLYKTQEGELMLKLTEGDTHSGSCGVCK